MQSWKVWMKRISPERYLMLALFLLAMGCWVVAWQALPRPLEVIALDVGKGDALLIRAPSGRTVLIDGGSSNRPSVGERTLVPNLMLLGVRKLDAVIITHPDSDHVNGLPAVLESLPVGLLLDPELPSEGTAYQQVLVSARRHGIRRQRALAGDLLNLASGCTLRIISPDRARLAGAAADDGNNNSIVALLQYRRSRMLFTGDIESETERALLDAHADLRADVLKVAHHGSRYSSLTAFLSAVHPKYAVISCPMGDSDHPHAELLNRLRKRSTAIVRTDVHGQIRLETDGSQWKLHTFRRGYDR